jgi:hypothetical protein
MTKSDKPTRKATPAKRTVKRKVKQESTKFKIDGKEVQDFFHYRKNLGATIQTAAQAVGIPRDLLHRWYAEAHERKPVKYATPEQHYRIAKCRAWVIATANHRPQSSY